MADKSTGGPEHTIKVGGVQIALWVNSSKKGTFSSVTIDRSYKDGDEWKRTKTFRLTDLVKIQIGISKLLEYLYIKDVISPTSYVNDKDVISPTSYVNDKEKNDVPF